MGSSESESKLPSRDGWKLARVSLLWGSVLTGVLTIIPIYLWFSRTTQGDQYRYWYGFQDHRSVIALYFLGLIGTPILVLISQRVLRGKRSQSTELESNLLNPHSKGPIERTRSFNSGSLILSTGALVMVIALVWLLWGPPWTGNAMHGAVDLHETVHYKGIQALLSGETGYINSASNQYGPLLQQLIVAWIQGPGTVSISGIRTAFALLNFLGICLVVLVLFVSLSWKKFALVSVVWIITYLPMSFYSLTHEGMSGFWGWGNPWRYVGILIVGAIIPLALQKRKPYQTWLLIVVGLCWGVTSLVAQENAIGGILVILALLTLAAASGLQSFTEVIFSFLIVLGAAAAVWLFYLIPYIFSGHLLQFLSNYLLIPRAVSAGYSATDWDGSSWSILFFGTPIVMFLAGITLSAARAWDINHKSAIKVVRESGWLTVAGLFVAAAVSQAGVLNRADASHLKNSFWILPIFLTIFVIWSLNRREEMPRRIRSLVGVFGSTVIAIGFLIGQLGAFESTSWKVLINSYSQRLDPSRAQLSYVADRIDAPTQSSDSAFGLRPELAVEEVIDFSGQLSETVKSGVTYVDPSLGVVAGYKTGYWYFVADLTPFPVPYEEDSMVITDTQLSKNLQALSNPDMPMDFLVTLDSSSVESQGVLSRGGFQRVADLPLGSEMTVEIWEGTQQLN